MGDCDFWEKSCVIYVIINRVNDMKYVGQTRTKLKKRVSHHKRHNEAYLGNAIRCYGWDNFEVAILEECSSPEKLDEREKYWIKALNCKVPNGYNLTDGGNTPKGRYVSEHERNLRAAINPYKRSVRCIDTGEIFPSVSAVERRFKVGHSTISAVCRGKQITAAGHRFEYVDSPLSFEQKLRQPKKPHTRKVCCIELNQVFDTITEAAKKCNTHAAHITRVCRGQRSKAGGYHWKYVD
ncbi:MAG: GIY-YIG nuclease family protein [Selenomonadaceae bacterium]|nr:GIY-YIG nuclease family protein [Selenomonadaceae bacterium]